MLKTINLKTKNKNYKVSIGPDLFKNFIKSLPKSKKKNFIIIDSKVYKTLDKKLFDKDYNIIKINSSEKIKSIENYWSLISQLLNRRIDRDSVIICIGGGAMGDLCGFIASTVLRGLKFILVPTTLLSQVDSSIGGKNGINSKYGKNLIGTFYQPNQVIIDPIFLKSLPYKQIKSGYAEIVKHAIINDKTFYQWLKINYKKIYALNNKELLKAIENSIKIKSKFVMKDENELLKNSHSRAILNFGHTFGHAIESTNNYKFNITHGEAISVGMIIASKISLKMKKISKVEFDDIRNHFIDAKLPIHNKIIFKKKFFEKIVQDKKNTDNKINLILLERIGKASFNENINLNSIKTYILEEKKRK